VTVSSTTDRATFAGNGVADSFPLPFRFFADGDIQAALIDDATLEVIELVLGVDYTLIGAGEPEQNGTPASIINLTVAPPSGVSLFVQRVMDLVQPTDIENQGRFFPEIHERVFDRLTMLVQQAALGPSRTIRVSEFDPVPARLPSVAGRAGKVFGFDENGDPVVSSLSLSEIEGQVLGAQGFAQAAAESADEAQGFASSAGNSSELAAASAGNALVFSEKSQEWAENPEDDPVEPGQFSSKHWAAKAAQSLSGLDARVTALEDAPPDIVMPRLGSLYSWPTADGLSTITATEYANRLLFTPVILEKAETVSAVCALVATAVASRVIRLGIYANDPSLNRPGDLIIDCGTASTANSGVPGRSGYVGSSLQAPTGWIRSWPVYGPLPAVGGLTATYAYGPTIPLLMMELS
jgi:hypothetical protein